MGEGLHEQHPLRASARNSFLRDKVEAEELVRKIAERSRKTVVTVLRTASILGPTVESHLTRYFSRSVVPTSERMTTS